MTSANVALTVVRLLRGQIKAPGAHQYGDVDTLDDAYLAELQAMLPEVPAGVPFLDKALVYLDE